MLSLVVHKTKVFVRCEVLHEQSSAPTSQFSIYFSLVSEVLLSDAAEVID